MAKLGVNIDHIATLRQQRQGTWPDPVYGALMAELNGADGIVAHLREDRRHIQESDVRSLRQTLKTRLSLEMASAEETVAIALDVQPQRVCLVPEKRQELTTEGGLDLIGNRERLHKVVKRLADKQIEVSLFIDPDLEQVKCAKELGAQVVELHTGRYADAAEGAARDKEFAALAKASEAALRAQLRLHAGHGLDYSNVQRVARIPGMEELNIGYSIIGHALFVGLGQAVKEMKNLI